MSSLHHLSMTSLEASLVISAEEAISRVLSQVAVMPPETKPILEALGQVLAEDVVAGFDIPPLDNSAMDGYAVRAEDTSGASQADPRWLRVVGDLPAGSVADRRVEPGTAIRIMTGAPVPSGADAVVQFENTSEGTNPRKHGSRPHEERVAVYRPIALGGNVRQAGEDVTRGSVVLRRGTPLKPAGIGILASLGLNEVIVYRRPRVAILSTGDELLDAGQPLAPGKIFDANSYSVAALVARTGGVPVRLGIARDNRADLESKLREAAQSDLILTSAGVSVGDFDIVKEVLAAEGEITFWRVRIKPGKPLAFGKIRGVPHLGLPGNPVSSMVAFELFARPAILKMLGKAALSKPQVDAVLEGEADNRDGRRVYLRAVVQKVNGQYVARLTGPQGSGILTSMALANALVVIPEDVPHVKTGDHLRALMLDWQEEQN